MLPNYEPRVGDDVFYLTTELATEGQATTVLTPRPARVVGCGAGTLDLQVFTLGLQRETSSEFDGHERRSGLASRVGVLPGTEARTWCLPELWFSGGIFVPGSRPSAADDDPIRQLLRVPAFVDMICDSVSPGSSGGDVELVAHHGVEGQAVDGYARLSIQEPAVFAQFFVGGRYRISIKGLDVPAGQTSEAIGQEGD